jgi:hypothetical protein
MIALMTIPTTTNNKTTAQKDDATRRTRRHYYMTSSSVGLPKWLLVQGHAGSGKIVLVLVWIERIKPM